jgi:hypothetical protein
MSPEMRTLKLFFFPCSSYMHANFAVDMLVERIDASPDFLRQVCFSDEVTFHVNGVVNRYVQLGSVVVKALCYKPEGRGFKSR